MSHLSDEDDEFLYGTSEVDNKASTQLDAKNDVDDLYDLYEDNDAKDSEQKEEVESEGTITNKKEDDNVDQDTPIPKASNQVEDVMEEVQEAEEDEESDDDLEIILEPEEEPQTEHEAEQAQGEQTTSTEQKETPVNIKPGQQGKPTSTPAANSTANASAAGAKSAQGGINLEAVGEYNGQPITDVDLDNVEDKPWRKPGADITDYFNYGFNEVTWRSYCAKQKMLRENKKMMGDMDMGDFMSMGMMMPPNMMDGSMPMPMPGMPNPMMGLPMGMPPPQGGGNTAMRNNRGGGQFNARGTGRNMPIGRPKNPDGKEREGSNEMMNNMEGNIPMDERNMFPMDFSGGPGGMPMNMFPPDMPAGPMGMPFFNPNMPGVPPMGFEGGDFRGTNNNNSSSPGRPPMRGGMESGRSQMPHGGSNVNNGQSSSNWRGTSGGRDSGRDSGRENGRERDSTRESGRDSGRDGGRDHSRDGGRDRDRDSGRDRGRTRDRDDSSDYRSDSRKRHQDRDSSSHQDDHYSKRSRR